MSWKQKSAVVFVSVIVVIALIILSTMIRACIWKSILGVNA